MKPIALLGSMQSRFCGDNIYMAMAEACDEVSGNMSFRYGLRPRVVRNEMGIAQQSLNNVAIVLQGPIKYENDFTLETIKFYRHFYPDIQMVLSTWKGVKESFLKECRLYDVHIVLNDEPKIKTLHNLNYQLISSRAGVLCAKGLGAEYALKTRTDQRILKSCTIMAFLNLLCIFSKFGKSSLGKRLLFMGGSYTAKYTPFCVCDFLSFGAIDDVLSLYSMPETGDRVAVDAIRQEFVDEEWKEGKIENIPEYRKKLDILCHNVPEMELMVNLYEKTVTKIDFQQDDLLNLYWSFLAENCILIGKHDLIDFYWPKYKNIQYKIEDVYQNSNGFYMDCSDWLELYAERATKELL